VTAGRDPATVSVGAGTVYIAALGTAEPVSLTAAWVSGWVDIGYTEKGTTFTRGIVKADVEVAEEFYPVSTVITSYTGTVDFALSQMTAQNFKYAFNGGTITTEGTFGVQFDPPAAGTETFVMLAWQSTAADERYIWRKCLQVGATATSRQKVLPQALLPVSFGMYKPLTLQPFTWFGNAVRTGS
jgi:hypothetical protein